MSEDPGGFVLFVFWAASVLITVSAYQGGFELEETDDEE